MPCGHLTQGSPECHPERTAGLDWYRAILNNSRSISEAEMLASAIQEEDRSLGSKTQRWYFEGYRGWATERIRYGTQGVKFAWETSGTAAPSTAGLMLKYGGKITRLDLQATWRHSTARPEFGMQCMRLSNSILHPHLPSRRPGGLTLGSRGYWCGTVGVRTSRSYGRLYDKGVEKKAAPPHHIWRIELEAKKDFGVALGEELKCQQDVTQWVYRRLKQWWRSQGFIWPTADCDADLPPVKAPPRHVPSAGELLMWLRASVAPTIPRLLQAFTVADVLETLGLDHVATPKTPDA